MRYVLLLALCGTLAAGLAGSTLAPKVAAAQETPPNAGNATSDAVILQMSEAYRRGDSARLAALLPQAQGNILEPWAAYWALRSRLAQADPSEVDAFLQRYAGTYQEDRLRNDWLLLTGKRRDWASFNAAYPGFRMHDDPNVRCYEVAANLAAGRAPDAATVARVREDWYGERTAQDGCDFAASELLARGLFTPADIWGRVRSAVESGRVAAARSALSLVAPQALPDLLSLEKDPQYYLGQSANANTPTGQELVALALVRIARSGADGAAQQLNNTWGNWLPPATRNWVWGVVGKWSALERSPNALGYYSRVTDPKALDDDLRAWQARAALRMGDWAVVHQAIAGMTPASRNESEWVYWDTRARVALAPTDAARDVARRGYQILADRPDRPDFYYKLALEALGQTTEIPPPPAPITPAERAAADHDPGLQRALAAIALGLRSEGVREWNYVIALHSIGGLNDRGLLAAADLACRHQVWDRCINTSDRTRWSVDFAQRFPLPYRNVIVAQAQAIGLDPAYVYGLIRQESRFVSSARSGVGASGLMQIMPATARWTAKKMGLTDFSLANLNDLDVNTRIGTDYLKLVLDDFGGSVPMAAAAYNAGPGRPRSWREGPQLEGAIWVENIPFTETRDYVENVLSNTIDYATWLRGAPQSLTKLLGTVGPLPQGAADPSQGLP